MNSAIKTILASNPDIKSIISVGSCAQGTMDRFSDIDLYIFTSRPAKYLNKSNAAWASPLGPIISRRLFRDVLERVDKNKIVLENGLMYDLTIVSTKKLRIISYYLKLKNLGLARFLPKMVRQAIEGNIASFYETIRRGYSICEDRINITPIVKKAIDFARHLPKNTITEELFVNQYTFFWQSCYTASVKLIRKDFYFNLVVYDYYLKKVLIKMIETRVLMDNSFVDTYYEGLKIEKWAGSDMVNELYDTMFPKNITGMQQALINTARLYRQLASEVAAHYGFPLNPEFENFVLDFIGNVALPESQKQLKRAVA